MLRKVLFLWNLRAPVRLIWPEPINSDDGSEAAFGEAVVTGRLFEGNSMRRSLALLPAEMGESMGDEPGVLLPEERELRMSRTSGVAFGFLLRGDAGMGSGLEMYSLCETLCPRVAGVPVFEFGL